ncbi:hypothetical protein HDU83_003815 [Entophlyctis luteolus]|nr:hypothetical protein HDU82_002097 [Entophlyctis luteolus]KAJ3355238.1 hypothetical protein HDU83_003815 [Entophlyctis luteolus]
MSTRTFIHDSLYNPHYGYFSRNARIFQVPDEAGIPFQTLRDDYDFMNHLAKLYAEFEKPGELDETVRQVWHTPTELFKPHYGNAIAAYIMKNHGSDNPVPLKIYEVGGGNGTLCKNILDFIRQHHPNVYARTEYTIIEISAKLATAQRLRRSNHNVNVVNKSIFEWDSEVPDDCFVIAMEVIDNFSHDLVRYTQAEGTPVQGVVMIDQDGDYEEMYEPLSDPLIERYLKLRADWSGREITRPKFLAHPVLRSIRSMLPFSRNLSDPEFLPTMNMQFLDLLHKKFPKHRLILSDFSYLPDAMSGHCAPVVQTRYKGTMVPVTTYLVHQGWFDIFFPTDFDAMARMYAALAVQPRSTASRVVTQRAFLEENAVRIELCTTKSGDVPLLSFYKNFKFFLS